MKAYLWVLITAAGVYFVWLYRQQIAGAINQIPGVNGRATAVVNYLNYNLGNYTEPANPGLASYKQANPFNNLPAYSDI